MRGMSIAGCAAAQIANGIASGIASIAVTVGGGGIIKIVGGFLIKTAGALAISAAASAILSFAIPAIAQSLFTNVFETATGIPAGELFTKEPQPPIHGLDAPEADNLYHQKTLQSHTTKPIILFSLGTQKLTARTSVLLT